MTKAKYLIKLGSKTLLESESIYDEIATLVKSGKKVLLVAGGAMAISEIYRIENREMPFITLANGDVARYCNKEEMPFILKAYNEIIIPYIITSLKKREIPVFASIAAENAIIYGKRTLPLKAIINEKKVVIRDSQIGIVDNCNESLLNNIFLSYDVICITPPIIDINSNEYLNIDADMLAAHLAVALKIEHIRFVTGTAGILSDLNEPVSTIKEIYIDDVNNNIKGRMKQKVKAAKYIVSKSVADVCVTGPNSFSNKAKSTYFFEKKYEDEQWNLLNQLVSIPSISGDEQELTSFLLNNFKLNEVEKIIDPAGNIILKKGNGHFKLMLLGHVDTVPFLWKINSDEEKLSGRGVVDAKASFFCFLEMLKSIEVPDWLTLYVIGAVEEEISSSKGSEYVRDNYSADMVIIGEPSGNDAVVIGYNGLFKVKIIVENEMKHSAGKESYFVLDKLYKIADRIKEQFKSINKNCICGLADINHESSIDKEYASGTLIVRVSPSLGEKYFEKINLDFNDKNVKLEILRETPGYISNRTCSLVKAFARAFSKNNINYKYLFKNGTSDMNTLAMRWSHIQMVAFGPGDSSLDHTSKEIITKQEVKLACKILKEAIYELFSMLEKK